MNLTGNKILITGGASGIGLGLTERFLQEGNTVIICGRRDPVLKEVKDKFPAVITHVCDLTVAKDRKHLFDWIAKEHSDLNVLINNAGIQNWMAITDDHFFDKAQAEIEINITAPLHLTSLFIQLPSLRTIVNITSGLAFVPLTKTPVYAATKAFLHSFTWSLRHLLKEKNIEVVEIIPPALNTDLGGKGIHDAFPPVSDFITSIFEQLKEGKDELTFGFTIGMAKSERDAIGATFNRMNGLNS